MTTPEVAHIGQFGYLVVQPKAGGEFVVCRIYCDACDALVKETEYALDDERASSAGAVKEAERLYVHWRQSHRQLMRQLLAGLA